MGIPAFVYQNRRKKLFDLLRNKTGYKSGILLLIGACEDEKNNFLQESFFWYLTGIDEPSVVMAIDLEDESTTLFIPQYGIKRELWVLSSIEKNFHTFGINTLLHLGDVISGYSMSAFFVAQAYCHLGDYLNAISQKRKTIYTLIPTFNNPLLHQNNILSGMIKGKMLDPSLLFDIAPIVTGMRRIKDKYELEAIFRAIEITALAQQSAAESLLTAETEFDVKAALEYIITGSAAQVAFPSIVASGSAATILHYSPRHLSLDKKSLLLIDIGARFNYYCADISRTYPVSGSFSPRQRELYQIVKDAQLYIMEYAQVGYWLNNKKYPEKSLQHIVKAYFKRYGYQDYFIHGIGHMLGLDVHDCDDKELPLEDGVVFTLEPGLYKADENIGIRLEDNYWLTQKGLICLSEHLASEAKEIELLVKQKI